MLLIGVTCGMSTFFLCCFYGKLATESYAKMANSLFESNWSDLPNDLQKYFVLMIGNAQQPLYYHGFTMVILELETFCKVSAFYHVE